MLQGGTGQGLDLKDLDCSSTSSDDSISDQDQNEVAAVSEIDLEVPSRKRNQDDGENLKDSNEPKQKKAKVIKKAKKHTFNVVDKL